MGVVAGVVTVLAVWVSLRVLLRAYGTAGVAGYDYEKIVLSVCQFTQKAN